MTQQNGCGGTTSCNNNKGADSPPSSEPAPELNSSEVAVDAELVGPVLIVEDNEMSVKVMRNMMIQVCSTVCPQLTLFALNYCLPSTNGGI
jgi:hypothetical protein